MSKLLFHSPMPKLLLPFFFFAILIILMLANCYMGGKMTIGPSISLLLFSPASHRPLAPPQLASPPPSPSPGRGGGWARRRPGRRLGVGRRRRTGQKASRPRQRVGEAAARRAGRWEKHRETCRTKGCKILANYSEGRDVAAVNTNHDLYMY